MYSHHAYYMIATQLIIYNCIITRHYLCLLLGIYASVNGPGFGKSPGYALRTILYYISDKLIGEDAWLNQTTTCDFPGLWRNTTTNSTPSEPFGKIENPSEYTGIYGSYFLPALNISAKPGDDSALLFQMSRLGGLLHSTQDKDRFLMEVTTSWEYMKSFKDANDKSILVNSTFQRNEDGEVRSIELEYEVKVVYSKDISILDDAVSGQAATLLQNKHCAFVRNVAVIVAFVFTMITVR